MTTPQHTGPADLEGALHEMGMEIYRSNDDEVTSWCPGHLRRVGRLQNTPKWSVNRITGLHNCWSCGYSGTFLSLVMDQLFPHDVFRAARWLRQYGSNLARASELVTWAERSVRAVEVPQTMVPETRLAMYDDVPDDELAARFISREAVDLYGVRWNLDRQSWIIPVRTPVGELAGWQEKWAHKRRFINDPKDMLKRLCLFGLDVFPVGEPACLLESPLDVLRLHTAGWEGGVSSYGASVSLQQMVIIEEITDEIVVALDDDEDGRLHAEELRRGQWKDGKMVRRPFAKGMHVRFFSYGNTGEKDLGGMEHDGDIAKGLYDSQHSAVARLGTDEQKRQRRGLRRNAKAVPGTPRRDDGRPRDVPADGRRRDRQDTNDHRGARGAARGVR